MGERHHAIRACREDRKITTNPVRASSRPISSNSIARLTARIAKQQRRAMRLRDVRGKWSGLLA